jgi:hypothetical protein
MSRLPHAWADLLDGGQLDEVHAVGQPEKWCHWRIRDQENVAARGCFENFLADQRIPSQVAQTHAILRVNGESIGAPH